jgi:NCS1 family nucleobase:cation symporter-1
LYYKSSTPQTTNTLDAHRTMRLRKPSFHLRIPQETSTAVVHAPGSQIGEVIEAEPDLLPVVPYSEGGPRTWGIPSLMGFWIAEAFGISQVGQ